MCVCSTVDVEESLEFLCSTVGVRKFRFLCSAVDAEDSFDFLCSTVDVEEEVQRGLDTFGFTSFKPGQRETITRILNGNCFVDCSLSFCHLSVSCWCCMYPASNGYNNNSKSFL